MTYTTLISVADLAPLVEAGTVLLFDCEFDLAAPDAGRAIYQEGHLPGAHYLHLDHDLSSEPSGKNGRHPLPDPAVFEARLRTAGLNAGQQVVAYDSAGGPYAARLWWLFRWLGHEVVAVLDGGKAAWIAAGHALESGEPSASAPGDFTVTAPDPAAIVSADDVLANIESKKRLVIDARTAERWRGEPSPLDPVSGHIPGSGNRWFKDNLGPDGLFKPGATLAADWQAVIGAFPPDAVIMQCGSGITACHNALAMAVAGLPGAQLYPGSWSEWISDPSRPVEQD